MVPDSNVELLIRAAAAGDADAMAELVQRHWGLLRYLIGRHTRTDVTDLQQEVAFALSMKAARKELTLTCDGQLQSLLRKVAYDLTIDAIRKRRAKRRDARRNAGPNGLSSFASGCDNPADICQHHDELERAWSILTKSERLILTYRADGHKYNDIAERLGIPRNTVGVKINRAKHRVEAFLRARLDK